MRHCSLSGFPADLVSVMKRHGQPHATRIYQARRTKVAPPTGHAPRRGYHQRAHAAGAPLRLRTAAHATARPGKPAPKLPHHIGEDP